jgi:hypothetical protein
MTLIVVSKLSSSDFSKTKKTLAAEKPTASCEKAKIIAKLVYTGRHSRLRSYGLDT